jgi:hypothetical protein
MPNWFYPGRELQPIDNNGLTFVGSHRMAIIIAGRVSPSAVKDARNCQYGARASPRWFDIELLKDDRKTAVASALP